VGFETLFYGPGLPIETFYSLFRWGTEGPRVKKYGETRGFLSGEKSVVVREIAWTRERGRRRPRVLGSELGAMVYLAQNGPRAGNKEQRNKQLKQSYTGWRRVVNWGAEKGWAEGHEEQSERRRGGRVDRLVIGSV
jgi:hypothetical protein